MADVQEITGMKGGGVGRRAGGEEGIKNSKKSHPLVAEGK